MENNNEYRLTAKEIAKLMDYGYTATLQKIKALGLKPKVKETIDSENRKKRRNRKVNCYEVNDDILKKLKEMKSNSFYERYKIKNIISNDAKYINLLEKYINLLEEKVQKLENK